MERVGARLRSGNLYMDLLIDRAEGISPDAVATYAWIIDVDHLLEQDRATDYPWAPTRSEVGTTGPENAPHGLLEALAADAEVGQPFRIRDDDGEVYYSGRFLADTDIDDSVETSEDQFGPLWDFGTPNDGATDIQYRNERGEWESL